MWLAATTGFPNTSTVKASSAMCALGVLRQWRLTAIVAGAASFNCLLALPMRAPRIFGDELIYWELSRGFAWTGHFIARGGVALQYGAAYPALLAAAQRIGGDQVAAFRVAQAINAVTFSLAAVPVYAIASRTGATEGALLPPCWRWFSHRACTRARS